MDVSTSATAPSQSDTFQRLLQYDFRQNSKFMEGWNKVRDIVPQEKLQESLVKAQVFFYSREVEPINMTLYKEWLTEQSNTFPNLEAFLPVGDGCSTSNQTDVSQQRVCVNPEPASLGAQHPEPSSHDAQHPAPASHGAQNPEPTQDHIGQHPTTFLQLIDMIQRGVQLPDTEQLNIEPTNEEPTQSALQRPRKPWEVSA